MADFEAVVDNIQLPSSFLQQDAPVAKKFQATSLLITINSNVSASSVQPEVFARVGKKLIFTALKLQQNFQSGSLLKPFGVAHDYRSEYKAPQMTKFEYGLERGGKRNFAHIHIVTSFAGPTHVNIAQTREYINAILAPEVVNAYVQIKFVHDGVAAAMQYVHKFASAN